MVTILPVVGTEAALARFHISLNVDDLARSVRFFELLFDRPATKLAADYAKFDLESPPLVLSLEPAHTPRVGKLNHLGIRLSDAETLIAMQRRLEMAGLVTTREDGVECCYSRQTKFWIDDPDGNLWEMYVVEEESTQCEGGQIAVARINTASAVELKPAAAVWAHRLGEPLGQRIFAETDSVDDVFLQGTFNAALEESQVAAVLREVHRVLRPGGRLMLHQLTAEKSLPTLKNPLPGPAAAVQAIPTALQLANWVASAGFMGAQFEKLDGGECLTADGVECRETRLKANKALPPTGSHTREIFYKGPFRQIVDDQGHVFRRGEWTEVDAGIADSLLQANGRDHFVVRDHI